MNKITVVIHTCEHEALSAAVSEFSFRKFLSNESSINIKTKIISLEDKSSWRDNGFKSVVRNAEEVEWNYSSPQAHLPLRFTISDYVDGICIVVDPDVFAVRPFLPDLLQILENNFDIQARPVQGGSRKIGYNSSVMIVNLDYLSHWNTESIQRKLFLEKRDIQKFIHLTDSYLCPPNCRIGNLAPCWNSYDKLNDQTILLHLTNQSTQPWKTGLPMAGKIIDNRKVNDSICYKPHPDPYIETFFFNLLREAVETDFIDQEFIAYNIRKNYIRPDILSLIEMSSNGLNN